MPILRRSCQACAKARRRCNLASPCCARCRKKQIPCHYINEPAPEISDVRDTKYSRSISKPGKTDGVGSEQRLSDLAVRGVLDTTLQIHIRQVLRNGHYQGSRPPILVSDPFTLRDLTVRGNSTDTGLQIYNPLHLEIVRVYSVATLDHMSAILRRFPAEFSERGTTAFVHLGLYGSYIPLPLQVARDVCGSYQLHDVKLPGIRPNTLRFTIGHLLQLAAKAGSFADTLAYAQAINLLQIIRLLEYPEISEDHVERDNKAVWELTHQLWQRAPTQLPSTLSPWQAWLFSENVRRTILVCNILLGVYSSFKRGYTIHPLCIEALPFDMRTQLWDAESERAWQATVSKYPDPSLVTLRQYIALRQPTHADSEFEKLLLLSYEWPLGGQGGM